jgi:hypothetical protein
MSRFLVAAVVFASLSSVVGCGGSRAKVATAADCAPDEASWSPPPEVAMSFNGAPAANEGEKTKTETAQVISMQPNRQPRPTLGAVHAATN